MADKPNILVIWGDDIGITNLSAYSQGLMGYRTPNIDRIANEGMLFTDSYGEQSCTAGRSAFITGQSVFRTGLSKVGKQKIEDTGPLTIKRMETCDDEFLAAAQDFISRQAAADTPFFVWFNTTHMHLRTHPRPEPFTVLRLPKVFNVRTDPFERADMTSNTYWDWYLYHDYMVGGAQALCSQFLQTFVDFPPAQRGEFHDRSGDGAVEPDAGRNVRLARRMGAPVEPWLCSLTAVHGHGRAPANDQGCRTTPARDGRGASAIQIY